MKGRLRLWLRSEQAMGLTSLPAPKQSEPPAYEAPVREAMPARKNPPPQNHAPDGPMPFRAERTNGVASRQPDLMPPPSREPFSSPVLPSEEKRLRLQAMDESEVRGCTRCRLCETRTHTVFGEGDPDARLFFIGEGPGETEDQTGRPFVGRAGEFLNKMISAMGLGRERVFIANIVKCRPPGNREPAPDEVATCTPYLERQIEIVRPRVIVTLGRPAAMHMLQTKQAMSRMRGQWHAWRGIKLMPTFHPAYVLRNYTAQTRGAVWSDLKQVMAELGLAEPEKRGEPG